MNDDKILKDIVINAHIDPIPIDFYPAVVGEEYIILLETKNMTHDKFRSEVICIKSGRQCKSSHTLPEEKRCDVSFTPLEKGLHIVNSYVEGKSIGPVEVVVIPKCELLGSHPRDHKEVKVGSEIYLQNIKLYGLTDSEVCVLVKDQFGRTYNNGELKSLNNSCYEMYFTPTSNGTYVIEPIWEGKQIRGANPVEIDIGTSTPRGIVSNEKISNATVGKIFGFVLSGTGLSERLSITLFNEKLRREIKVTNFDVYDGSGNKATVEFIPQMPLGIHRVDLFLDGHIIQGGSFRVKFLPNIEFVPYDIKAILGMPLKFAQLISPGLSQNMISLTGIDQYGDSIDCKVKDTGVGSYEFSFVPSIGGTHTFKVLIDGEPMAYGENGEIKVELPSFTSKMSTRKVEIPWGQSCEFNMPKKTVNIKILNVRIFDSSIPNVLTRTDAKIAIKEIGDNVNVSINPAQKGEYSCLLYLGDVEIPGSSFQLIVK